MHPTGIPHKQAPREHYLEERCHIMELFNTAADPEVSVARARVEPGVTTRLHRLIGITERYLILEGKGRVEIGTQPAQVAEAGDVFVIAPGVAQRISNTGAADLVFLAVCTPRFTSEAYEDIDPDAD
jgi:mannose-6-phosphate isomerase-like protein (cupin superfamily)